MATVRMNPRPLRRLVVGPPPAPGRVMYSDIWFRGHNNQRYAELIPRLERVDPYLFTCSDRKYVRGVQFRTLHRAAPLRHRVLFRAASRYYGSLLAGDRAQIAYFPGRVVADADDPRFTPEEVDLLNRPNVAAYVVVNERVARRYEELGVRKPCHIVPHGVTTDLTADAVEEIGAANRDEGEVVVGYMGSWLLSREDRNGDNPLYNVDHLLDLWEEIGERIPNARLWLIGGASDRVRDRCAARDDIRMFGRIPRDRVLEHVANFDVALYPRTADKNYQTAKIVEYMGCGVPIVSYDYQVTAEVRDAGAGLLVETPREFVGAVERLSEDQSLRKRLAASARAAGVARDWDTLARLYDRILDKYLAFSLFTAKLASVFAEVPAKEALV